MFVFAQLIGILAVNLIPLAGVLWFGWSVFEVIFLYWFENVAIGVTHFLKMRLAAQTNPTPEGKSTANFFAMHYGIFTFVHGIFVIALFGVAMNGLSNYAGGLEGPVAALIFWQFASLALDYLVTEKFKGQKADDLLFQPYPRMLALHVTIIAAGWLISEFGAPIWTLVILVVLKTAGDYGFYFFQFRGGPSNVIVALRKNNG